MNKKQREILERIKYELDDIMEEEQEKYDDAPENLQGTERVEKYQENADNLLEIIDLIDVIMED